MRALAVLAALVSSALSFVVVVTAIEEAVRYWRGRKW